MATLEHDPRRDSRCEGFDTKPGVRYHAHDLPRCTEQGTAWMDGRWLCDLHRTKYAVVAAIRAGALGPPRDAEYYNNRLLDMEAGADTNQPERNG